MIEAFKKWTTHYVQEVNSGFHYPKHGKHRGIRWRYARYRDTNIRLIKPLDFLNFELIRELEAKNELWQY